MPRDKITGVRTEVQFNLYEVAWAAGFFDGEGCTYCTIASEKHNPQLRIGMAQLEGDTLNRFNRATLNLATVGEKINNSKNNTYIGMLRVNGFEKTQAVISILWRFLSGPKKKQYNRCLRKYMKNYKGKRLLSKAKYKMFEERATQTIPLAGPATVNAVKEDITQQPSHARGD